MQSREALSPLLDATLHDAEALVAPAAHLGDLLGLALLHRPPDGRHDEQEDAHEEAEEAGERFRGGARGEGAARLSDELLPLLLALLMLLLLCLHSRGAASPAAAAAVLGSRHVLRHWDVLARAFVRGR